MRKFLIVAILGLMPSLSHGAPAVYTGHFFASSATIVIVTVDTQRITSTTINLGGVIQNFRTFTTSDSINSSDYILRCDSNIGEINIQLPSVSATPVGRVLIMTVVEDGAFFCNLVADGSEQIGMEGSTFPLQGDDQNVMIVNNGSKWDILSKFDL